ERELGDAAVLLYPGRAPRPHGPVQKYRRIGRSEQEGEQNEGEQEAPHSPKVRDNCEQALSSDLDPHPTAALGRPPSPAVRERGCFRMARARSMLGKRGFGGEVR